jgi:hypothetical protein
MKTYKTFCEDISPFRNPVAWWNQGRNTRIPNENQASLKDLANDDWQQRQGRKGPGGKGGWDPTRGFRVQDAKKGGLRSGPTPAVRQAFERPVRTIMRGGQGAARLAGGALRTAGSVISGLAALGRLK